MFQKSFLSPAINFDDSLFHLILNSHDSRNVWKFYDIIFTMAWKQILIQFQKRLIDIIRVLLVYLQYWSWIFFWKIHFSLELMVS